MFWVPMNFSKLPGSLRLKRLRTTALEGAGFIPFFDTPCNIKSSLVYPLQSDIRLPRFSAGTKFFILKITMDVTMDACI